MNQKQSCKNLLQKTNQKNKKENKMPVKIYLIAGEPSGDLLGARVMRYLKKKYENQVSFFGIGGETMQAEGLHSLFDIKDLSVMGFLEVVPSIPLILKRLNETIKDILKVNPDIVMTIDSFSYSARVHKRLKKINFSAPHVHCVAPQVWAWKKKRAKRVSQYMDHLFCLLPYEEKYFTPHGMKTSFIGHPVIEGGADKGNAAAFRKEYSIKKDDFVLCMLPGSRKNEVAFLMEEFMKAAEELYLENKNMVVVIPTVATVENTLKNLLKGWKVPYVMVMGEKNRYEAFAASDASIAASGTVSLELALAGVPHLIAYRVSKLTGMIAKKLLKIKYVNLINILADQEIVPELLQEKCMSQNIVATLKKLLSGDKQNFSISLNQLGQNQKLSPSEKMGEELISLALQNKRK